MLVTVQVSGGAVGTPVLTVTSGAASALVNAGGGAFTATVTPSALDIEMPITATLGAASVTRTALVLTTVDAAWGQPVAIDGLVNTPGWEDGENVSPDGQWLFVASYLPVDLLSCINAGGLPSTPACTTVIGPYAAPARPGMLGAERISGNTFANDCPDLGITTVSTAATFAPGAAFGFHRQADGSFAEPFVIGFAADGCTGPYGFSFTGTPSGNSAGAVFAYHDFSTPGDFSISHLYYAPITLGSPNILGTYSISGGLLQETGFIPTELSPITATRQGNPAYAGGRLWWDDENLSGADSALSFANVTGTLPTLTAGSAMTVGVVSPGNEEIQPALDGNDLYWFGGGTLHEATLTAGADPSLAASWSAPTVPLGPAAGGVNTIVATGEPTVAHVGGAAELYFVYIKRTATGFDSNVGRVTSR